MSLIVQCLTIIITFSLIGKEQPEDSMNPEFDDDITGDGTDNHEICYFCDSGDQGSSICPIYQKS